MRQVRADLRGGQRELDPLERELQVAVDCLLCVLQTEPEISAGALSC